MSLLLLEKLKQKPIPQKQEEFKILLSKPENKSFIPVEVKTKILDKTKEDLIDRQKFLKTLDLKVKDKEFTKSIIKNDEKDKVTIKDFIKDDSKINFESNVNYIKNISKKPLRTITLVQDLEQLRLTKKHLSEINRKLKYYQKKYNKWNDYRICLETQLNENV